VGRYHTCSVISSVVEPLDIRERLSAALANTKPLPKAEVLYAHHYVSIVHRVLFVALLYQFFSS
jgi:hypothetical protein